MMAYVEDKTGIKSDISDIPPVKKMSEGNALCTDLTSWLLILNK